MNPRLLLFEPDALLRADLAACLTRAGYSVHASGESGAAADGAPAPRADAALAAVAGPEALAAFEGLVQSLRPAPVFATTSGHSRELSLELLRRGAAAILRKPFSPAALLELLASELRARRASPDAPEPRSPRMASLLRHADALARSSAAVLILGEHGSGRRWLARRIHARSARATAPLARVEVAEWEGPEDPEGWREEGRLASAWRGARGGTLVVCEVSELPAPLQRALAARLTADETGDAPRLIATARGAALRHQAPGSLLPELWLRLSGAVLELPPLRERLEDVPDLARHFLSRCAAERGTPAPELRPEALAELTRHPFRGNLLELENLMRRAVLTAAGPHLDAQALLDPRRRALPQTPRASLDLRELERQAIERALAAADGNRTHASRALGISVRTLRNKLHRYGLAARD